MKNSVKNGKQEQFHRVHAVSGGRIWSCEKNNYSKKERNGPHISSFTPLQTAASKQKSLYPQMLTCMIIRFINITHYILICLLLLSTQSAGYIIFAL